MISIMNITSQGLKGNAMITGLSLFVTGASSGIEVVYAECFVGRTDGLVLQDRNAARTDTRADRFRAGRGLRPTSRQRTHQLPSSGHGSSRPRPVDRYPASA